MLHKLLAPQTYFAMITRNVLFSEEQFRSRLVEFEREHESYRLKYEEQKARCDKKDSYIQKLEARVRNLEKKNDELGKQNKYSDRDRRELEAKV